MIPAEPENVPVDELVPIKSVVQGLKNSAKVLSFFMIRQTIGSTEISLECTECLWRLNVSTEPTPLIKLVNEAHQHYYECEGSISEDEFKGVPDDETGPATD